MSPSAPAVPIRVDLVTPDLAAARDFYAALLGWTYTGTAGATQASAADSPAATLRTGDAPASWWTTFAVADAGATRAAATAASARVDGDEVHDPLGGSLRLRQDAGPATEPGPGRPCWYEYMTTDAGRADRFLADTLALHATVPPGAPDDTYALLIAGGRPVGGRLAMPAELAAILPTGWMVYFMVSDPDAAAAQAESLGGRVLVPPRDVATGRVAALADPSGATFTVIRPAPQA